MTRKFFIAPAGSNVSYIEGIFGGDKITPNLSYHTVPSQGNHTANMMHSPIDEHCIKIVFKKFKELIVLNWHYKLRLYIDDTYRYGNYGKDWEKIQKEAWKNFGLHWETRSVLRWMYSINADNTISEQIPAPGSNFDGCSLYEGYIQSKNEFARFGIAYKKEQYDQWKESQHLILSSWEKMNTPDAVETFAYDFEKGVYLGLHGIRNNLTEDQTWDLYIK